MSPPATYIISRTLDPLFALTIGISAAVLRIRREEVAKGGSGSVRDLLEMGRRRAVLAWNESGSWSGGK